MIAALVVLAVQAAAPSSADAPRFRGEGQMKIFDMICGRVFPTRRGSTPLWQSSPARVR